MGLIDDVMTSEEYLTSRLSTHQVIKIKPAPEKMKWFAPGGPRPAFSSSTSAMSALAALAKLRKELGGKGGTSEAQQLQVVQEGFRQVATLVLEGLSWGRNTIFCMR